MPSATQTTTTEPLTASAAALHRVGSVPDITARQWLSYVRNTSLDFGSHEILETWGDGEQSEEDTLQAVQENLGRTLDVFGEIFSGRPAIAFRGLPLGWKSKLIRPDGSVDRQQDVYDSAFDFQAWLKMPFDRHSGGVSTSWTWDEVAAINEGQARGPTNTVLKAEIPVQAIDWLYSFSVQINDPDEKEIRLKPEAKIHLLGVRQFDFDEQTYTGDWIDLGGGQWSAQCPRRLLEGLCRRD